MKKITRRNTPFLCVALISAAGPHWNSVPIQTTGANSVLTQLSVPDAEVRSGEMLDPSGRFVRFFIRQEDEMETEDWLWDTELKVAAPLSQFSSKRGWHPTLISILPEKRTLILKENRWNEVSVTASRLVSVHMDSLKRKVLVPEFPLSVHERAVSSDGSKLFYRLPSDSDANAFVMDLASGKKTAYRLSFPARLPKEISYPEVSDDGQVVAARDSSSQNTLVWLLPAPQKSTAVPEVKAQKFEGRLLSLSPDGKGLSVENAQTVPSLYVNRGTRFQSQPVGEAESLQRYLSDAEERRKPIGRHRILRPTFLATNGSWVVPYQVDVPSPSFNPRKVGSATVSDNTHLDQAWVFAVWSPVSSKGPCAIEEAPFKGMSGIGRMDFCVSDEGKIQVVAASHESLSLWVSGSPHPIRFRRPPHSGGWDSVSNVQFSRNGRRIAMAHDGWLSHFDLDKLQPSAGSVDVRVLTVQE
jgi:hypothetical protein